MARPIRQYLADTNKPQHLHLIPNTKNAKAMSLGVFHAQVAQPG
jgi:hypothetical protein